MWAGAFQFLILVLALYEYKEMPHKKLSLASLFYPNLLEILLNPPSCLHRLFLLVSTIYRR